MRKLYILLLSAIFSANLSAQISLTATAGTTTGTYSTLKASFDAINAGTHRGTIVITVTGNTTETASAVLNASGSGSASYSSVNIYPTVTGLSISGNLAAPLINLNGASHVTIDGRVNATGATKDLMIVNSSTSSTAGTSTIQFINDAVNNTIHYCTIKGSTTDAAGGILLFSTTIGTLGNSNDTITNNNITNNAGARPVAVLFTLGLSATYPNTGDAVTNNNIYDFFNQANSSYGVRISNNNTAWSITGNSFYETTSFASTVNATYFAISISFTITSGSGFTVTGNYIGGSAPSCGGTAWTKTNAYNNSFYAIYLNIKTGTANSVQNNTITNFNWANSSSGQWYSIYTNGSGDMNVGTTTGNTIGAATGNGAIIFTGGANNALWYGVYISSSGANMVSNNIIGSITLANSNTANTTDFCGIYKSTNAGTTIISNNTIGSTDAGTSNSINATSTSTTSGNAQTVVGIQSTGAGTTTISDNNISKMTNGTTNTNSTTYGYNIGILTTSSANTISNNIVRDLTIANANTSNGFNQSVVGIAMYIGSAPAQSITGNTIYNLSNSYASFAGNVVGIYYNGPAIATGTVSQNFIYNLSVTGASSTTASIYGIDIVSGATTYANNIISLGGNTTTNIYGIYETGAASNDNSLYFNTVYIGGSPTAGADNSYALYSSVTSNARNFRNNIFMNARSNNGATGKHYAAYFAYGVSTNLTLNYNDYYAPGTGAVLGYYNSADVTSLPLIATMDANSLNIDPLFNNAGGTSATDYFLSASLPAVTGTGITTDYSGTTRNVTTPRMGAWGVNSVLPIKLISFSGYANGNVNQLNWITSNEMNSNYFELQRSADGINFSSLGIIKSKGNSYSNQNYNYTDAMPLSSKNYYRLKQVDIDGSFTYSSIIMIANNSTGSRIIVYPNPTSGEIIIATSKSLTTASIRLLDISGRMILQQSNVSGNSSHLNITDQPAGIYFIEVNDASVKERFKILKQ